MASLGGSGAVVRTVFEVVNPKDEDPRSWVSDQAQILSSGELLRLERDLTRLYEDTGAEIAVVTLQDVEGADTADAVRRFATDLFNEWGIGAARLESGLLVRGFPGRGRSGSAQAHTQRKDALRRRSAAIRGHHRRWHGPLDAHGLAGQDACYVGVPGVL